MELWGWIGSLPPSAEGRDFEICVVPCTCQMPSQSPPAVTGATARAPTKRVCARLARDFALQHNRVSDTSCGVRVNTWKPPRPGTGEPYLKPVRVELCGERPAEAITLPPYLQDAYTWPKSSVTCLPPGSKVQAF